MMTPHDLTAIRKVVEDCLEEFDDFISTLDRYPPNLIVVALGIHLHGMVGELVEDELCSRGQALDFVQKLHHDMLEELNELGFRTQRCWLSSSIFRNSKRSRVT